MSNLYQPSIETLTPRQRQARARRNQILETAVHLFAQNGFDGTSTRQIADEAGISEGLIFHYFPTKADLLSAVLESRHGFVNELRELLSGAETQPASEMLPELATLWLNKLCEEKAIILVLFGTAQTNPEVGQALQAVIREGTALLATYLRARMQRGELRTDLPAETSALMFFASQMIFFVANRDLPEPEWRRQAIVFAEEMVSVWMDGARS